MELEARKKLEQFFIECMKNEKLSMKSDDEIKKILCEDLKTQEQSIKRRIEELNIGTPINIANEKRKDCKIRLEQVCQMQKCFDEVIGELLLEFRGPQQRKELANRQRQEVEKYVEQSTKQFRDMIKPEVNTPTVEERLSTILEEASKKYPIPSKEDISEGHGIGD